MKKNLIILVAVLLTSTFAFAQSGKMFVTGQLGFNTWSTTNTDSDGKRSDTPGNSEFNIMGEFHYKITDNIAVGLGIKYDRTSEFDSKTPAPGNINYFDNTSKFSFVPSVIYGIKITDNFKYIPRLYLEFGFGSYDNRNTISFQTT